MSLAQCCDIASPPLPPCCTSKKDAVGIQIWRNLQQGSKCTVSFLPTNTAKCLFAIEVSPCTEAEDDAVTTRSNTLRRMKAVRSTAVHE